MNWDAIGAVAESIGALGVIASLAYLGIQIRQSTSQSKMNTAAIEATAFQQLIDHNSSLNMRLMDDPGLLKAFLVPDEERLDPMVRLRFIIFASVIIRSSFNAFCLFEKNLISEEQWRLYEFGTKRTVSSMVGRQAWAMRREEYPPAFVKYVDQTLAS